MRTALRPILLAVALLALLVPSSAAGECVRCAWFSFPLDGETFQDAFCIYGFAVGGRVCIEGNLACATAFDCVATYDEEAPDVPTVELADIGVNCGQPILGAATATVSLVVRR